MTTPLIITAGSVNEAFVRGLRLLNNHGAHEESRNGPVIVAPGPVITHTTDPMARVLFGAKRDANPFFHLFEALWMLAGRNDLPWLAQFNAGMTKFSDDGGQTQPGAYGYRWKRHFGFDQLEQIVAHLEDKPGSRRAVLQMWSAMPPTAWRAVHGVAPPAMFDADIVAADTSADVPCNTNIFFSIREASNPYGQVLDMSVQCRSNDAVWGAHGANAVHFSVLQEYMAARLDCGVGEMYQYSFNYHLYPDNLKFTPAELANDAADMDAYRMGEATATPLFDSETVGGAFERELQWFMTLAEPDTTMGMAHPTFTERLFIDLALPMLYAWRAHKAKDYVGARMHIRTMPNGSDWQRACDLWLARRQANHAGKQ